MDVRTVAMLLGGTLAGGTIGVVSMKMWLDKKYQAREEKMLEEMREYYKSINDSDQKKSRAVNPAEPSEVISEKDGDSVKVGGVLDTTLEFTVGSNNVDYSKIYGKEESEEDEEEPEEESVEELSSYHEKNKNRPPRIISMDKIQELTDQFYDVKTLFYYTKDESLWTEDDEPIEDPESLVGDALTKYDFDVNDERVIYVQNFELDTVYEVTKVDSYHPED